MRLIFYLFLILFFLNESLANNLIQIKIDSSISPASSQYLKDAIKESKKHNSSLILIELDTPGGLVTSTRIMVQDILNSNIPIVMYVSPKGARATSAGTFLMYASHIAAMSPSTNIGAATPVNLMPSPNPNVNEKKDINKEITKDKKVDSKTAMEKKIINDTSAYIKSIAEHRNRNVDWAIQAVKEGESISAKEALEKNVIDIIANDVDDLLKKIHGKKVIIADEETTIKTQDINIIIFNASWKTKFLMSISNPNIAYIFLIVAMYGILFEMMNPGSIFPGVVGAVSALIALYALNILPFNYVGLLLIFLGITFMIMEVFMSGFGIMGIAGVIAFAFGSVLLFDEKILGEAISIPLILAFSFVSLGFFVYLMAYIIKIKNKQSVSGLENLIGTTAEVVEINDGYYKVFCNGELWNARSKEVFKLEDKVVIESFKGLNVEIRSPK